MTDFVHLHVHSAYSLLNGGAGASSLEALAEAAAGRGMSTLALTDVNGVYGAMDFRRVTEAYGLRPVYGVSLETATERAVLLPLDAAGWASLCRAVTARHNDEHFVLRRQLSVDRGGLAVLTADTVLLDAVARESGTERLYVELVPGAGGGRGRGAAQAFARRHGVPPVATNAVWFAHPQDHARHRLLAAVARNATLTTLPASALAPRDAWLKPGPEMARLFPDCPEALRNAVELAERCGGGPPAGRVILPAFAGADALAKLRELTVLGARRRYGAEILSPVVQERIEHELAVIAAKHYADYFLVVWDVVTHAPTHCGRGSVANSIVSYCLGLTHVDPLAQGLVFERFLNPGRRDPPDADLDFPWDERDRALEYVFRKYGAGRAAMVANHVTFQRKAALREVAKVYGRPATEIAAVTKRLPWADGGPLPALLATHPNFRSLALGGPWPEIASLAESLVGLPRNLSLHPGGVVIVPDALTHYVPVEPAAKRIDPTDAREGAGESLPVPTIQFEKDGTEDAGLVKIDLLGNRSLAVIRDAIAAVGEHEGVTIDYTSCDPEADEPTRTVFRTGNTMGVFYTESPASRLLCQKSRADSFDLLVLNTSIIRPASNRYINTYLARLHGAPYEPPHPVLRDVLAETFGVMVYQEDVVNVCVALAGMDVAAADGVRKALTKKRPLKELRGYEAQFRAGAAARGVDPKVIDDVWDMILSFSGYSFCKGHSASYIQVALQSAYLRAHYPAEFIAAVLSNEGGYYAPFAYIAEARRMGLAILPPDVNASEAHYTGRGRALRIGLQALKGLTADALARLVAERRVGGPYASLEELRWRAGLSPGDLRVLIQAGACDSIARGRTRPQLMWLVDAAPPTPRGGRPSVSRSQGALDLADTAPPLPPLVEYDAERQLRDEFAVLGYLASCHPMTLFADTLRAVRPVPAPRLPDHVGKLVTCAGMLTTAKPVHTIRDEPMEFVTFDDGAGLIETVIFPDVYRRVVPLLFGAGPYLLRGRVEESYGAITLTVTGLERLERLTPPPPQAPLRIAERGRVGEVDA